MLDMSPGASSPSGGIKEHLEKDYLEIDIKGEFYYNG